MLIVSIVVLVIITIAAINISLDIITAIIESITKLYFFLQGFYCLLLPVVVISYIAGLVVVNSHAALVQLMFKYLKQVALGIL